MDKPSNATENITFSLPSSYIEALDWLSDRLDLSKSAIAKKALRNEIIARLDNLDSPAVWEKVYQLFMDKSS